MQIYLVGGALRDRLLGLPVRDRDFVVVGATGAMMQAQGFRPVGKDFPVFLHPESGEEYALARAERKTGPGYHGFCFDSGSEISLQQDLARRDLTINAIAEDSAGHLIDPHGGLADLRARYLRHVSEAFVEDPVRVLRVARFAARLAPLGFRIAPDTLALMRRMAAAGELAHLVAERVWAETAKALSEPRPGAFLRSLRESAALAVIFPELDRLYGVPQRIEFHPEFDTGIHLELALNAAARIAPGDDRVGFAVLGHDLGKALTARSAWPRHIGHEGAGVPVLAALCQRLRVPREHAELARHACLEHLNLHRLAELRAPTVLALLERIDAFRRPERLSLLLAACAADLLGRAGVDPQTPYPPAQILPRWFAAAEAVRAEGFSSQGLVGAEIGAALRRERIEAIAAAQMITSGKAAG